MLFDFPLLNYCINKAGAKTFASAFWFADGYYVVEHARPFTGKEVSRKSRK